MFPQRLEGVERRGASFALVRLDQTVGLVDVAFQAALVAIGQGAQLALKGFLTGVDSLVRLQVQGLVELGRALVALEAPLPGVDPAVELEVGGAGEVGLADVTLVGLLAGVDSPVRLEVGRVLELRRTLLTLEGSFPRVRLAVFLQAGRFGEGGLALRTFVIALPRVDDGVLHQVGAVAEHLGARPAPQRLVTAASVVPRHVVLQQQGVLKGLQTQAALVKLYGAGHTQHKVGAGFLTALRRVCPVPRMGREINRKRFHVLLIRVGAFSSSCGSGPPTASLAVLSSDLQSVNSRFQSSVGGPQKFGHGGNAVRFRFDVR